MSRWSLLARSSDEPRPWWDPAESAPATDHPRPTLTLASDPASTPASDTEFADASARRTPVPPVDARRGEQADVAASPEPPAEATPDDGAATPTVDFGRPVHGITARGVFVAMAVPAAIGCVIGFLLSGAVAISPLAGWGLLAGSLFAGWKASPRLGMFPVFLPPLAMFTVVAILGQVTVIGSRPTVIREVAMIVAGLTATAPAQVASVLGVAGLIWFRRRSSAGRH